MESTETLLSKTGPPGGGLILFFSLVLFLTVSLKVAGADEVFQYDLKWLGIKAGRATLSFIQAEDTIRVVSEAYSADWVSLFYRVEDRAESLVSVSEDRPPSSLHYRLKVREGRHRRDKEVIFLPEGKARYIDHLKGFEALYDVPSGVFDPLGGFFYLRQQRLRVGQPVTIKVFDSKRLWDVRVEVLRRERVKTKAGEFDTIVVKPELRSEGIFQRKGDVYIYLSDDPQHIPVMVKTKVVVGHVVAELVRIER